MTVRQRCKGFEVAGLALACVALASCATSLQSIRPEGAVADARKEVSSADADDILLSSGEVVDGSVLLVTASSPGAIPEGEFEGNPFLFYPMPTLGQGIYQALVGIPHAHAPGPTHLTVRFGERSARADFLIKDANYRSEKLKVQERKVNPLARDMARIKREQKLIGEVYSKSAREKLWNGAFLLPIDSPVTSAYGTKRVYNGQLKNFHSGVDLRAKVGTPIRSPAAGKVLLAKSLFFTGNTVIIDHGYGLITLYAHMSRMRVRSGARVGPGQLLGLAGQTGRVSGPHLHWMAMVHKVKVDPMQLMKVLSDSGPVRTLNSK